jgi:hypothetical protein
MMAPKRPLGAAQIPAKLDYEDADGQVCESCGVREKGSHHTKEDCINALRDVIAEMEDRLDALRAIIERFRLLEVPELPPGSRGGWRDRPDNRMVILDGDRISLTDAARRLGMSVWALHQRIVRRTRDPHYGEIDLRATEVDVRRSRGRKKKQAGKS